MIDLIVTCNFDRITNEHYSAVALLLGSMEPDIQLDELQKTMDKGKKYRFRLEEVDT